MSFTAGDNIEIANKVWTKIADTDMKFQIKTNWSNLIYYYEGTEDLADSNNALSIKLKDPNPLEHEIGYIQSGFKNNVENFRNVDYVSTNGPIWIYVDGDATVLKDI